MKKRKTKKERTYVCQICGKGKKSTKKIKCCGKDMRTKDKAWVD